MRWMSALYSRTINPSSMGAIKSRLRSAHDTLYYMPDNKSWLGGGYRSAAIAAELIRKGKIVALPTDTIYGLAGLAQNENSVAKLYEIKERDMTKPFSICVCDVDDIEEWAHTEDLPEGLINELLPGPTTIILKRKDALNPKLNPGVPNVGIRIPKYDFVRSIVKMVDQPLALTSANKSGTKSTLHPNEFEDLWPQLDGVFYETVSMGNLKNSWRKGSTIVDLTVKGQFTITRKGIGYQTTVMILKSFGLQQQKRKKKPKVNEVELVSEESLDSEISEDEQAKSQASA